MYRSIYPIFITCLLILIATSLTSCVTIPNNQKIDDVPMYGQPEIPRPELAKEEDSKFINNAISRFGGNRNIASLAWCDVAEDFYNKGNYHYAMRRYNQAWLLNPDNYKVYWGFGRVMLVRREYEKAFDYFEKAKELVDDPYQKPALLSDVAIAYNNKANSFTKDQKQEREKYFGLANDNFEESTKLDPTYINSWINWAFSLYFQGDYQASWSKVKKARTLDASLISAEFLMDLSNELPEPN